MPFIPKQATGNPQEELIKQLKRTPIPLKSLQEGQKSSKLSLSLGKLNLHSYEPDFNLIYKTMFNKDPEIENNTRRLIFRRDK